MKKKEVNIELCFWIFVFLIFLFIMVILIQPVPYCFELTFEPNQTILQTIYTTVDLEQTKKSVNQIDYLIFRAMGESMNPEIKDNSDCFCYKKDKYELGDIVVFFIETGKGWQGIGHEIIKIQGENITTKGINNKFTEEIKEDNILCAIPKISKFELIIKQSTGG